jgi:hypothetical protein
VRKKREKVFSVEQKMSELPFQLAPEAIKTSSISKWVWVALVFFFAAVPSMMMVSNQVNGKSWNSLPQSQRNYLNIGQWVSTLLVTWVALSGFFVQPKSS